MREAAGGEPLLTLQPFRPEISVPGHGSIRLTPREAAILGELVTGQPVERNAIIAKAWPPDGRRTRDAASSFNVIMCHLRQKIAAAGLEITGPGSGKPKPGKSRGYQLRRRETGERDPPTHAQLAPL